MSNTTIQLKKSGQTGNTPSDLNYGEVAINYADGKLFYKNGVGIKAIENQKTFSTINSNNSLIIATTPTDILSLVAGSNITINSNTTSKTITINSTGGGNDNVAFAAYNKANSALANTSGAIFGGELLIGGGGKLTVSAVGGDEGGEILLGKAETNTTLTGTGVTIDVYQNRLRFFEQGGSARGFYLDISTGGSGATTDIMSGGGGGGNDTVAFAAYAQANNASSNTVALQSVNNLQNTNITSINTFAGSAFNSANAGVTLATAAYDAANTAAANTVYLQTVNDNQNTSITATNTLATAAYGKANAEGEINNTQNTWITNTNTLAQAAYDHANTRYSSSGGTISGSVTITNNLDVLGNVSFVGNVTSIQVTGNSGQFFGYASNGFNALYAGIPVGYDFQPQTIIQASANEDGYAQINIQNINGGGDASSDLVATADNGTENDTYVSVGIGSSNHSDPDFTLVGPNDGYLYVSGNTTTTGGDLVVGTFLPQNDIIFAAGGMNTENEQMRIIGSSNTILFSSKTIFSSNLDLTLVGKVDFGFVDTVHIYGGSSGQLLSTDGIGNLSFINSPVDLATAAYGKANAESEINNTQNTNITNVNTFAGSAFNSANAALSLAQSAYAEANNQGEINNTQNTNIISVNTFAVSAFNSANAGVTLAAAAYAQANSGGTPTNINTRGIRANSAYYPTFVDANNATNASETVHTNASLSFNPHTGTVSATIFSTTSDETLKENVKTIENAINTISQLRGVTYTWKNNGEHSMGLIAQEVEKVLPIVVRQSEDKKTVDYQNIIGLLVEAIKEQQTAINNLEEKINNLK